MGKLIQQLDTVTVPRCSVQEEHEQQQVSRWPSNNVAMGTSSLASHVLLDVLFERCYLQIRVQLFP